jgi:cell division protein ZapE
VVPLVRKTRLHFHEFMRDVHRQLDELRGVADPLDEVAKRVAKKYRLICFDEFHISDVADAMIMYNLLKALFDNGVSFIMTSNYDPNLLYPDGLHRDRILPTIALLYEKLDVMNIDAGIDYRGRALEQVEALHAAQRQTDKALRDAYASVAETADEDPVIRIEAREIRALRRAGTIIWFDFNTLCGGPRSQNDYLEIASRFHTVILSGVPMMSAAMSSEARRFTWLIDVFYDQGVKLLMSAEVEPEELYTRRDGQRIPPHRVAHRRDAVAGIHEPPAARRCSVAGVTGSNYESTHRIAGRIGHHGAGPERDLGGAGRRRAGASGQGPRRRARGIRRQRARMLDQVLRQ